MKNAFYGIALVSSLVLTACGGSGPDEPKIPGQGGGSTKLVSPVFVLSEEGSDIPVPNDLLFSIPENAQDCGNGEGEVPASSASCLKDLTLNIPLEEGDDPADKSNPRVAMNAQDGWSSHAPFSIKFDGDINGTTVVPGQTARIFKTSVDRPVVEGTPFVEPTGNVTAVEEELVAGVDFVTQVTGTNSIAVIPLKPLQSQANYTVVLTNGIQDTSGNALIGSPHFSIAKSPTAIPEGNPTSALEPVREKVDAMMAALEASGDIATRDDVVLAFQFTVQSIPDALATAKLAYVDAPLFAGQIPQSEFTDLGLSTAPFTGIGAANLYKGSFTTPYLLTPSSALDPAAVRSYSWVGADFIPDGEGGGFPNPLAGGNLTYANVLAQKQSDEQVPLFVSLPANPGCAKPYPVMIFQHGITRDRTDMIGIADTMASVCTAVIAMDAPLHGLSLEHPANQAVMALTGGAHSLFESYDAGAVRERTFGVDLIVEMPDGSQIPGPDGIIDSSGAHTINLSNLLVARDNFRQGALDLLALEKAIPFMDVDGDEVPDFLFGFVPHPVIPEVMVPVTNTSFMAFSLGGFYGGLYTGLSDYSQQNIMASTGGSIAQLANGSDYYGPVIRGQLASAFGMDPADPVFLSEVLAPFLFAAQTVLDSGDPVNYAEMSVAKMTPTLSTQIKNDDTVPNFVATAPLAGSIPFAALTELNTVTVSGPEMRGFAKFVNGNHRSTLDPSADPLTTIAIQTAIATFIATSGNIVDITDPALVEP